MEHSRNKLLGRRPGLTITAGLSWRYDRRFGAAWCIQLARLADDIMINVWIVNTIPIKHEHLNPGVFRLFAAITTISPSLN